MPRRPRDNLRPTPQAFALGSGRTTLDLADAPANRKGNANGDEIATIDNIYAADFGFIGVTNIGVVEGEGFIRPVICRLNEGAELAINLTYALSWFSRYSGICPARRG